MEASENWTIRLAAQTYGAEFSGFENRDDLRTTFEKNGNVGQQSSVGKTLLHLAEEPIKPGDMPLEQKEFLEKIRPLLEREGVVFQKKKNVYARPAQPGETIQTATADGLETTNSAGKGDFIVRNQTQAGEAYIVPADKFAQKYRPLDRTDGDWLEYRSIGRIIALELTPERMTMLNLPDEFEFIAPWGSPMVAKTGDYLGSPERLTEVYRIARKEFFETYTLPE